MQQTGFVYLLKEDELYIAKSYVFEDGVVATAHIKITSLEDEKRDPLPHEWVSPIPVLKTFVEPEVEQEVLIEVETEKEINNSDE
jgi:hypothetical protein